MDKIVWKLENTKFFHVELSNYCNAACPSCPRYIEGTSTVNPDLILNSVTVTDFKKWFPIEIVKESVQWLFIGTSGDPMMCKDVYEICEYILSNSNAYVQINTNGSIRDSVYWKRLGKLFAKYIKPAPVVVFSIDGLKDTNHLYRRNVNWDRLMQNVESYIGAGAYSQWDYLVFKHNEHQLEDAKKLSKELGFNQFNVKRAFGFETNNPDEYQDIIVFDKNGEYEYSIEPPSVEYRNGLYTKKTNRQTIKKPNTKIEKRTKEQSELYWSEFLNREISSYKFPENSFQDTYVDCFSCKKQDNNDMEIYVDANGNVLPCCFVGTIYNSDITTNESIQLKYDILKYGKEKINLNKLSLSEILSNGHLNTLFAERWDQKSKNKIEFCHNQCGKSVQMKRLKVENQ